MTTASKSSGSGSPVSTTANVPGSRKTGVLSLAPTVSAARTAMPSMADASNEGEDRVAHTGAAVTRPTASCSAEAHDLHARGTARGDARRTPGGERLGGRDVVDEGRGRHGSGRSAAPGGRP